MPIREAQTLPEAAADAIDALVHLAVFASAEGHDAFASAAMAGLRRLVTAPQSRQVIPAEYFTGELPTLAGTWTEAGKHYLPM